jgi:hypothetical protein
MAGEMVGLLKLLKRYPRTFEASYYPFWESRVADVLNSYFNNHPATSNT